MSYIRYKNNNLFVENASVRSLASKLNTPFYLYSKNNIKNDIVYIKFEIENPVTKLELLESPDARKLGILVESLKIINN